LLGTSCNILHSKIRNVLGACKVTQISTLTNSHRKFSYKEGEEEEDEEEEGEEKEKEVSIKIVEGTVEEIQETKARREKIEKLIQKLKLEYKKKDGTYENYDEKDNNLNAFLKAISDNVLIEPLRDFLKKHTEVFPLYSLNLKYGEKIVFMTNDGVLTDGEIILPYTGLDMVNKTISANLIGNWTFTKDSDYQEALKVLSGEVERIGYIDTSKISKEGVYKGGKRKTLSKKLLKRVTKRNRK
jgi:hypothetical protein